MFDLLWNTLLLQKGNVTSWALVLLSARLTAFEKRSFTSSLPCRVPRWMFHRGTHNFCTATMYARSFGVLLGDVARPCCLMIADGSTMAGFLGVEHVAYELGTIQLFYRLLLLLVMSQWGYFIDFHSLALTIVDHC